jgi:hypothetical protein
MINKNTLEKLLEEGKSYKAIGDMFGVSKQRVQQLRAKHFLYKPLRRASKKVHANASELYVASLLQKMGHTVTLMPYNHPFDLLVNGTIRVEIKHCKRGQGTSYHACNIRSLNHDIFVFVTGEIKNATIYIVRSNKKRTGISAPIVPKHNTIYQKLHRENWALFDNIQPQV